MDEELLRGNAIPKPWITKEIRKSIGIKNEFFFLVIGISINFTEIKVCTFLELVKEHFITIILRNVSKVSNVSNVKKTWEGINALISHKKVTKLSLVLSTPIVTTRRN